MVKLLLRAAGMAASAAMFHPEARSRIASFALASPHRFLRIRIRLLGGEAVPEKVPR